MTVPDATLPGPSYEFRAFCAPIITRLDATERAEVYEMARTVDEVGQGSRYVVDNPYREFYDSPEREDFPEGVWSERDRVLEADLLIHLSHFPARASGTGEAWDFAFQAALPQLILGRGPRPGRRLMTWTTAPKYETEYVDVASLRTELGATLELLRPFLTQRRLEASGGYPGQLAARARHRRAHLNLSQSEVARAAGLDVATVAAIESGDEADASCPALRALAFGLKLTVAELTDVVAGTPRLHDVD